jgi:hypothetical protein
MFAVVLSWAGTAVANRVALASPDITCWSGEVLITITRGIEPVRVPGTADALAGGWTPTAVARVVTWAVVLSPSTNRNHEKDSQGFHFLIIKNKQ